MSNEPLLSVRDLSVTFERRGEKPFNAVDGVSFDVHAGKTLGLVGESGCGKSVTSLAIMGLLPHRGNRVEGSAMYDGTDLLKLSPSEMRDRRGRDIAMIFQDPLSSLNPVVPIGIQVTEVMERHRGLSRKEAMPKAQELLERVGIPDPKARLKNYPHQLSGGMRQRALIAMSLACEPRLLIADEPTTALDVTIQAQILALLKELVEDTGTALIMITHDLGVVAGLCDEVNVLYGGRIVERTGVDLREVDLVVASGGVLRHGREGVAGRVLDGSVGTGAGGGTGGDGAWQLPEHPDVVVDSDYLLAAVGLLADAHPDVARRLAASLLDPPGDLKVHE